MGRITSKLSKGTLWSATFTNFVKESLQSVPFVPSPSSPSSDLPSRKHAGCPRLPRVCRAHCRS